MLVNDWDIRKTARDYVHYIYRNTEVEDLHAAAIKMDMSTYEIVKKIVEKQIGKWERNYAMIYDAATISECKRKMRGMNEQRQSEFAEFVIAIAFFNMAKFGSNWDEAVEIEPPTNQNIAEYVLSGKFLECCKSGTVMDDIAMREINRDIHNRVYTLMINGLIPCGLSYAQC